MQQNNLEKLPIPKVYLELEGDFIEFNQEEEYLICKYPVLDKFFNPMDVVIPEGHVIKLEITESGEDYLPSTCSSAGVTLVEAEQPLSLPTIDRPESDNRWFEVPVWWE